MKPAPFEYAAPASLAEAVSLLQQSDGEAKVLSGGQSLMPLLNMRLARPELLVDLARIGNLDHVRHEGGTLCVGAMARQRALELTPVVREKHPIVRAATMLIAHPQNRNQGTVCGSLAHADPAAELPALALAVDAEFHVIGPDGERVIPADEFFVTFLTTALEPTEILTEVRFPALPAGTAWSFTELARRHGDFALAGAVTLFTCDAAGRCATARIVLFGVGATPVRAAQAEQMLLGETPSEKLFAQVGDEVSAEIEEPSSDVHASGAQRRALAGVLTRRALAEAAARRLGHG